MESEKMASWRTRGSGLSIDTEFVAAAPSGGQSDNGVSDCLEDCLSQEGSGRFLSPMASSALTSARDIADTEDCAAATFSGHEESVRRDSPATLPEEAPPVGEQADPVSESSYEEYSEEEEDLAGDPSLASFTSRLGRFQSGTSLSASPPAQRGNIERELAALSASRSTNFLELAGLSASRSRLAPNPNVVAPRELDMEESVVVEECLDRDSVGVEECRAQEWDTVDSAPVAASPVAMEDFPVKELDTTDAPVAHRDSLVSIDLSNMRSGIHREPLMTPKDQCDSARSSMLSVASPCRSPCRSTCRSPPKGGRGSPAKVALADRGSIEELDIPLHRDSVHSPLSHSSSITDHRGSLVFNSDMRQLLSPREGECYPECPTPETSTVHQAGHLKSDAVHPTASALDMTPRTGRQPAEMTPRTGRQSVGSVCSLRYMKSGVDRAEATGTPTSNRHSQEFISLLLVASPCRSSPTRSASGSPNRLGFRRSDISDRRASASLRSDIQHMISPRKAFTRDSSPRHPSALSPVSETDEAPTGPSAPPALRRARESHPLLFSPPVLEPQVAVPDAAVPDAAEPRRTSTQRRCLELQLDQCEEQLRQEKRICQEKDEALQEEQLRRAAAEMEPQERLRNARQQEQRLLEGQRALATESRQWEQRLLESQGALEARTRQDEQSLLDSRRALEQEILCFNIERENAEEDRRNFLLHHVHEADAALIRRERELCEKVRELDAHREQLQEELHAHREQLQEELQEIGTEKEALTTAGLHLAESAKKLTEREERVTLRERRHAETMDRASQTPVFRAGNVRLPFCRRACSFVVKVLIFLAILAPALFLAHGSALPQLWNDLRLHAGSTFKGIGGALRQNGLVRECPPCVQCPRGPRWPVVWHPPRRLATVPAASPPTNSVVDAATMGGLGAALVYLKAP